MKKGMHILGTAILWAVVIIASALALRGTDLFSRILLIQGGGAAASFLLSTTIEDEND